MQSGDPSLGRRFCRCAQGVKLVPGVHTNPRLMYL